MPSHPRGHSVGGVDCFLVERYLPATPMAEVEAAVERLSSGDGSDATHLWTAIIEAEETCLSMFEAPSAAAVEAVNRAARFPFDRVVRASVIDVRHRP
jgi:hypothetical protein